jgi:hypothetical protein
MAAEVYLVREERVRPNRVVGVREGGSDPAPKVRLGSGLGLEVTAILVVLAEGRGGPQGQYHGSDEQDDALRIAPPNP